jgi:hypothetical protein
VGRMENLLQAMNKINLVKIHRVKKLYDDCKSIDEMLEVLGSEITHLEDLREMGGELEGTSEDGKTKLVAKVLEGSPEHKEFLDREFIEEEIK